MLQVSRLKKMLASQEVLKDISFEAEAPCIIGITGENGAGKTTLIRILASVLKADGGRFSFSAVEGGRGKEWRSLIAYVPQEPALDPELSVRDNLLFWSCLSPLPRAQAKEKYQAALTNPLIAPFSEKKVKTLSGGMARRANLMAGLMGGRELLLLDEPFAAADKQSRDLLIGQLLRLREEGAIIVLASHEEETMNLLCDRVFILDRGRMRERGDKSESEPAGFRGRETAAV